MESSELKSRIGACISRARKRRGLTLEKLAYEAGVSKGNLSDIESGKKDPRASTLFALAEALDTHVSNLLKDV